MIGNFEHATPSITAFDWVPGFAQGFVRDLRLRWALEEASLPYDVEILAQGSQSDPSHLSRQPFGQIPTLTVGTRSMFESGACVWRIAETSAALLPESPIERDACFSWYFAAIDTVEEPVNLQAFLRLFAEDREAADRLGAQVTQLLHGRLQRLSDWLGKRDFLVANRFTVADLMMTFVLRNVVPTGDLDPFPALAAYVRRHEARPAFQKALGAQLATFAEHAPRYEAA